MPDSGQHTLFLSEWNDLRPRCVQFSVGPADWGQFWPIPHATVTRRPPSTQCLVERDLVVQQMRKTGISRELEPCQTDDENADTV